MAIKPTVIGINNDFTEEAGSLVRQDSQVISQAFLDDMKERRDNSKRQAEKDYMHVAAIPLIVVEKWQREGFDILHDRNISLSEIVLKLKNENLDAFLATEKSV